MAPSRDLKPSSQLRRVGIISLVASVVYGLMAVGGWAAFSPDARTPATEEAVVVSLVGFLAVMTALLGVIALTAASRFPVVAHLAGPNDFLAFLTVALTAAGLVALAIGDTPGFVIVPLGALGSQLMLHATLRKVLRSPDARAPGEA